MRRRLWIAIVAGLLCLAGAWFFWPRTVSLPIKPSAPANAAAPAMAAMPAASASPNAAPAAPARTNQFAFRLSNTPRPLSELMNDRHAILLENAFLDTSRPLNLSIPKHLRSEGDPGAYIVQARGPVDAAFRALLAAAGAQIISYIPNDAYLVRLTAGGAGGLAANALVQAVIPYEPYFKIQSGLLAAAVAAKPLTPGVELNLGLFADDAAATLAAIKKQGATILAESRSPFGLLVKVKPRGNWTALVTLPGVQRVETAHARVAANDLTRATLGVAADTVVPASSNYMGLSGLNVLVQVNDTGIDATHPDLTGRVVGGPLTDLDGHGTHVAGILAGDGTKSLTVTNAPGSITPATNGQFRGQAPAARLFAMSLYESDQVLQESAAQTNALISNNSWGYGGDYYYDLEAASYDAAVRDALPGVTGSQPVLFVFAAGNSGGGDNDGSGGTADTILSPATAKNVISVGALEQLRGITNVVTKVVEGVTNTRTPWVDMTDTSYEVARYSSRGNVGIGSEGDHGRFKPDVVAPGTFVISTRSGQWDEMAYYNPTNYSYAFYTNQVVDSNSLSYYGIYVPENAVGVSIRVIRQVNSPVLFPTNLPIYVSRDNFPDPNDAATYDFVNWNNQVSIPPDSGGVIADITSVQGWGFNFAVGNTNRFPVNYSMWVTLVLTNNLGDYYQVLSNLNNSLGGDPDSLVPPHYYRYESGTSMAAPGVSGVLALIQDYFTNVIHAPRPTPALLKALVINGARATGYYDYQVQNTINYGGWGLVNLPNTLPPGLTNQLTAACSSFYLDQDPLTALATGARHTYRVSLVDSNAPSQPLRVTLTWTDPPGDPSAAIKLVNNLDLIVTNLDDPANPVIYYGNDIAAGRTDNTAEGTNTITGDVINNVENVYIREPVGTNYSITVVGRSVNVNAVTAHPDDVVQDYALVISLGQGGITNAFTVTDDGGVSAPASGGQRVTGLSSANGSVLSQLAGANTPLRGTNLVLVGTNLALLPANLQAWIGTNGVVTIGMTNQWHFYVVTNLTTFTNAAFVTYLPATMSVSRMGALSGSLFNATRPEADIDVYVAKSTSPQAADLINLDATVISNCIFGVNGDSASLGRGGNEFVAFIDSHQNDVYYVGVKAECQTAGEYGFIALFSEQPFSQMNTNGSQSVLGGPVPMDIPDGNPALPGYTNVFALALFPMEVKRAIVTNDIAQQNLGDLVGSMSHSQNGAGVNASPVILMNHNSPAAPGEYQYIYDDSGWGDIVGARVSDGPGSLNHFVGGQGVGPWILHEADSAVGYVGTVQKYDLLLEPHHDLTKGVEVMIMPGSWFYEYIEVPAGATNLTIYGTNVTAVPETVDLFVRYGALPTLTAFDFMAGLTNVPVPTGPPGNSISIGPPIPPGRYWIGLYNEGITPQSVYVIATLGMGSAAQATFTSGSPVPILDDAVTTVNQFVPSDANIASLEVGLRVDHPRVSDLVFHLVSPGGTRVLLVENRGGTTPDGMGATFNITNIIPVTASGGAEPETNVFTLGQPNGTITIYYTFYTVPDQMVIYDQNGNLIFNSGVINGSGVFNVVYTNSYQLTIVMNPGGGFAGTGWDYVVNALQGRQSYLVLTEDTNRTTTPIKFAPTPFAPVMATNSSTGMSDGFDNHAQEFNISAGSHIDGWLVAGGNVDVYDPSVGWAGIAETGTNVLDLNGNQAGSISTNIATIPGKQYFLTFAYTKNASPANSGYPFFVASANILITGQPVIALSTPAGMSNNYNFYDWQHAAYVFTATSPTTTLQFDSLNSGSGGMFLDSVNVREATAPFVNGFDEAVARDYAASNSFDGWTVTTNQVTVISNTALARTAPNLLALADGRIARTLPTLPGASYVLTFKYRGPGAAALWRAETGTTDSINGNNPTAVQSITYETGEVGDAFRFDGSSSLITMPASASLAVTNVTFDAWIYPTNNQFGPMIEYGGGGQMSPIHFWVNGWGLSFIPGTLFVNASHGIDDDGIYTAGGLVPANTWSHVAYTLDAANGIAVLYYNGVPVVQSNYPTPVNMSQTFAPVNLGYRDINSLDVLQGFRFAGLMDEVSIYNRDLSRSEIEAIYNHHAAGKYNTNAPSIAAGLAEAQVTLNGTTYPTFFGDNNSWQTMTFNFTASQTNTPLAIAGLEPGMLLDDFILTTVNTNSYDLYYLPEQYLGYFKGENARGDWTLEIQDDRVGATAGPAPSLLSWNLHFTFNTTIPAFSTLTNGMPITNTVPPGGVVFYFVSVPTNADWATNILFSTNALPLAGPLNLWFNQTTPPLGITPPDDILMAGSTGGLPGTGDRSILGLATTPTNIVPGGFYYLGVQNTNTYPVTYGIQVDFHFLPTPPVLPFIEDFTMIAGQTVIVTNTATDTNAGAVLVYSLVGAPAWASIDINGLITLAPTLADAPTNVIITTLVDDTFTGLSAMNSFNLVVIVTNGLPAFPGAEGAGTYAMGGRFGDVYHVVNLRDDGPGSLRFGLRNSAARTIVFDVSGTITNRSQLIIRRPYVTIAGQTAPGDGITLRGRMTAVRGTHDVVIRFLRFRVGDVNCPVVQDDSFNFDYTRDSIADHVSASWSIDETLSATDSTNVTVQWSMIADSLNNSCHASGLHGYGSLLRYGSGAISYHHNLYADNYSRNPRLGDNLTLDFINNVIGNWGIKAGYNADDTADNPGGFTNRLNYVGNYLIAGSSTVANLATAFEFGVAAADQAEIYQSGNEMDSNRNGVLDGTDTGWGMFSGLYTALAGPVSMPGTNVTTSSAAEAFERVLDFAGAWQNRDAVDSNIVAGVRSQTGSIIDSQNDVGGWPVLNSRPAPVDTDQDGLPDYWEITLGWTGEASMDPLVANNNHINPDGYTDLEHYINWLAAPHALTLSNTPVAVNLYALAGRTGNLAFGVTDGTNGTVTLGTDGHTATFTPTNTYFGFASFDVTITNLVTTNMIGPVTVSVMVSAIGGPILTLTNGVPLTNSVPGSNGIVYFAVSVPTNADFATNILLFASAPVRVWYDAWFPPTAGQLLLPDGTYPDGTNGSVVLSTNTMPPLVPGSTYYLGVENTNAVAVTFALEVDFHLRTPPFSIASIVATNFGVTNGYLLTWFAPANDLFMVQWTTNLQPLVNWQTFTNIVGYDLFISPANSRFTFFDDGSQTGGFGPVRFYRLLLLQSANELTLPAQVNRTVTAGTTMVVNNTATDSDTTATLNYVLTSAPAGAAISTNGIITWTSTPADVGSNYVITTVVMDNGLPPAVAVNSFTVTVVPPPVPLFISSIVATNLGGTNGYLLTWYAPTNDYFVVQWTTNLLPLVSWQTFTNIIGYDLFISPTNSRFTFFDDGSQSGGFGLERFYRLRRLGAPNVLTLPYQANRTAVAGNPLVVYNTATDSDASATLNYVLTSAPAGAVISTNGIINWTPAPGDVGTNHIIATAVTDNGLPPALAANSFTVTVIPPPVSITSVTFTTNGLCELQWSAATNYQFQVAWTTNLAAPVTWQYIPPAPPYITATNSTFIFVDTNAPTVMKFYRLVEYP